MATRDNLNIRRIHLGSGTCVLCGTNDETVSHLFFRCKVAIHILHLKCVFYNVTVSTHPITFFLFIVVILLKRTCIWNVWFISKFFNLLNMLAYFVCFVVGIYYYAWEEKMFQVIILDNGKTHSFVDICICRYNVCSSICIS